jgi:hypothetical protein
MTGIPFLLLVLAAGVYLLIQTKSKGLSGIYKILSWLVIVLSLVFILAGVARGIMRYREMAKFRAEHPDFMPGPGGHGFGHHHGFDGHGPGAWKPVLPPPPADCSARMP